MWGDPEGYEHTDGREQEQHPGKPKGAIALADAIPTMGAMTKLTISGDESYSMPVTMEASMTEADFSGKYLMASGAIMLAAFLPKCQ